MGSALIPFSANYQETPFLFQIVHVQRSQMSSLLKRPPVASVLLVLLGWIGNEKKFNDVFSVQCQIQFVGIAVLLKFFSDWL